jgi:hypothetical protein
MPNLKMFVGDAVASEARIQLHAALPRFRALLCEALSVDIALAQFAIVTVQGIADQAQIAIEIQLLPRIIFYRYVRCCAVKCRSSST